jgi:ABC-2 type transport system ATP-binding protein
MTSVTARVAGLRFEYPGVRALDDVSFDLAAGSVTALVGPNGAGKSTLLRCMAGLEIPVLGSLCVGGVDVIEQPREAHRRVGYLSDFFGVYEALTVRQCLAHAAAVQGRDATPRSPVVERTAARLDLAARLDTPAGALSRGLRQRLAIGQAVIHEPEVLLLDEPAAGLDPEARSALAALFRELQAGGMTLVVSSHILAELDEYSTDMLVLRSGRVVEHRPLEGRRIEGETRTLRVVVAQGDPRLAAMLAAEPLARVVAADERSATFAWTGDEASQAALLRRLVEAGLAPLRFEDASPDLNASYLRSVQGPPR